MQLVTLNHLKIRYLQLTRKELTSLKCFSYQFIHSVLAGFLLANPFFFQGLFSQVNVSSKKGKIKTRQLPRLACPMHASYGPGARFWIDAPGNYRAR